VKHPWSRHVRVFKEFEKYLNIMALPENWGQANWTQRRVLFNVAGKAERALHGTPQAWALVDFFDGTRPSEMGLAGGSALRVGIDWWCGPQSWDWLMVRPS
jgi:hypothetical protein